MCVPLKTDLFPGPRTAQAIAEDIIDTLKDFGLSETRLLAAVSDCGSNMVRGLKKYLHIRCADHRIHRALTFDFYKMRIGKHVLELRSLLMRVYRHLLYRKTDVARLAKQEVQGKYLDELSKAEEIERVREQFSESVSFLRCHSMNASKLRLPDSPP